MNAPPSAAAPETERVDVWATYTPSEVAERMIASRADVLAHRKGGKRAAKQTGEQTHRQIRWAAKLLEKSLPQGTPMARLVVDDLIALDEMFEKLPTTFGKRPEDRADEFTLAHAAAAAAHAVAKGEMERSAIGLAKGTTNRHFLMLGQIHRFLCEQLPALIRIDFAKFVTPLDDNERDARKPFSVQQGRMLFRLPPWTGCAEGSGGRLKLGKAIIHDSLYFVLLLTWYTGARREELCKLLLADVKEDHPIPFIRIQPTETGRIKNQASRRDIVICDELLRLGFSKYVTAMRAEGETLLFPESSASTGRKMGDVFYKLWWMKLERLIPGLERGQAMHAFRHTVSTELKNLGVFSEFRDDLLGHKGRGEGETRYASAAELQRIQEVVNTIPIVTDHLPTQTRIRLLPKRLRVGRQTRRRAGPVAQPPQAVAA